LLIVGLNCAANTSIVLGQLDEALEYLDEALRTARAIGAVHTVPGLLSSTGNVFFARGDATQAARCYCETLHCTVALADVIDAADGLAWCAADVGGSLDVATRLIAFVETQCAQLGTSLAPGDAQRHARALDLIRRALDNSRFHELWAEGAALDADEAFHAAQELASELLSPAHTPGDAQ
jgi:tetratricopeptide (TPR) repeat protein